MSQNLALFNTALSAFDSWSLISPKDRLVALSVCKPAIPSAYLSAFEYQYDYAKVIVDKNEYLVSPTGESNELYTQGRGVAVMLVDIDEGESLQSVFAMLAAIVIAGNSLIICTDNTDLTGAITRLVQTNHLPVGIIAASSRAEYSELMNYDIRNFVYIGDSMVVPSLNKALSLRPSAITALVAETDLVALPVAKDPMLALQFVTERVRTTNITAIGGNAMLLELGSDEH
ncbi:1-pyrroline-5-carboxylate dehydrogenase [Vibrio sp. WJH972]